MKLLMILLCKGTCAPLAPVMHPRSGVPTNYSIDNIKQVSFAQSNHLADYIYVMSTVKSDVANNLTFS